MPAAPRKSFKHCAGQSKGGRGRGAVGSEGTRARLEAATALDDRQVRQPHGDDLAFARRVVDHDVVAPRRRIPAAHQAVQPIVRPRLGAYTWRSAVQRKTMQLHARPCNTHVLYTYTRTRTCACNMPHAPCTTQHAPRTTQHAPYSMHRAPYSTHTPPPRRGRR